MRKRKNRIPMLCGTCVIPSGLSVLDMMNLPLEKEWCVSTITKWFNHATQDFYGMARNGRLRILFVWIMKYLMVAWTSRVSAYSGERGSTRTSGNPAEDKNFLTCPIYDLSSEVLRLESLGIFISLIYLIILPQQPMSLSKTELSLLAPGMWKSPSTPNPLAFSFPYPFDDPIRNLILTGPVK
jgi:hypothetical protein